MRREFESRIFYSASVPRKLLKMPRVEDPGALLVKKFGQLMIPFQFLLKQANFGFIWENLNDRDQERHHPELNWKTNVGLVRKRKFKQTEQGANKAQCSHICGPCRQQHLLKLRG